MDYVRVLLGGLLLTSWLSTFYLLYFEEVPPFHILLGFVFLSAAIGILFTYWRGRHLAKRESETWDSAQGRHLALFFMVFYVGLSSLALLVSASPTLSDLIFAAITGGSFGFFLIARRIAPFVGATPYRALPLHGFVMLMSAAFTVIGVLFVFSHDQSTWLGLFVLMAFSALLSYYFGEPFLHQPA